MIDYITEILKQSVEKNGEVPLTNVHLLNIIAMAYRQEARDEVRAEMESCRDEIY